MQKSKTCTREYVCTPPDKAFLFLLVSHDHRHCKLQTRHDRAYFGDNLLVFGFCYFQEILYKIRPLQSTLTCKEQWILDSIYLPTQPPPPLPFLCRCWRVEKEEVWVGMRVEERLLWERVQLIESGRLETQMCPGDIGLRGNWKAGHSPSQQNQCGNEYWVSSPAQETPIESAESLLCSSIVVRRNWATLWNIRGGKAPVVLNRIIRPTWVILRVGAVHMH